MHAILGADPFFFADGTCTSTGLRIKGAEDAWSSKLSDTSREKYAIDWKKAEADPLAYRQWQPKMTVPIREAQLGRWNLRVGDIDYLSPNFQCLHRSHVTTSWASAWLNAFPIEQGKTLLDDEFVTCLCHRLGAYRQDRFPCLRCGCVTEEGRFMRFLVNQPFLCGGAGITSSATNSLHLVDSWVFRLILRLLTHN